MTDEARVKAVAEVSHAIGGPGGMDHWLAAERFIAMRDADDAWKAANHPNRLAREVPRVPIIATPQDPPGDGAGGPDEPRRDTLIWSGEHEVWWRPLGRGYTSDKSEAGRWSYNDALATIRGAEPEKKLVLQKDEPASVGADPLWLGEAAKEARDAWAVCLTGPLKKDGWYWLSEQQQNDWCAVVRAVLAFAARQPHKIETTGELVEVGIEAAADAVSALPKGQQAWGKKEYMIAETAARAALEAALKVKP